MLRHLKNANELVLYSGISCGLAFASRLVPGLWFPVLLLRLAVLAYSIYVIANVEKNKEFAFVLGGSVMLGCIGGYWDLIEIYFNWNPAYVLTLTICVLGTLVLAWIILNQLGVVGNGKTEQK